MTEKFTRCLDCVGHELTRDECFYAGRCLLGIKARLAEWVAQQDAARGRPLTDEERLANLRKWLGVAA